jgi:putative transposase
MARFPRVVAANCPHHITQRGNAQRPVFQDDIDRAVYLRLLAQSCEHYELSLVGYCLMDNHVHLVGIPAREDSLSLAMRQTHGRYASYLNGRQGTTGHVWQGRFYSCALDANHLWSALRYTEMNPVRAGMLADAGRYRWSSAAAHCGLGGRSGPIELALDIWRECWNPVSWRAFLRVSCGADEDPVIRSSTHSGRPLGSAEFVEALEHKLGRSLVRDLGGRPRAGGAIGSPGQLVLNQAG